MDAFAEASIKELESDLPFKSLVAAVQAPGSKPPSDAELRKMMEPLIAVNDVKALAALWRGFKTLKISDQQLKAVRVPSLLITGSKDVSAAGVPDLNQRHPQIRTLVVPDAEHGGPAGVMRRVEFMTTLREFLAATR
jgi:pimeloyl-ACP methyl ester carboxylesterase